MAGSLPPTRRIDLQGTIRGSKHHVTKGIRPRRKLSLVEYEDRSIKCVDCGENFIWTGGEQVFFHDKV